MNKRETLAHIESLMAEALTNERIMYVPGGPKHTFRYEQTVLTVDTSFQCLERLHRRVKRPMQYAKKKEGARLAAAIALFQEDHRC
jgi:hypothetical protein